MSLTAIEIGRRRLRAVRGARDGDGVRIDGCLSIAIPLSVEREDPAAFGSWLGEALREHGFRPGRALMALSRDRVALKRLELPTTDENELPGMVRLAIARDLPFDAEDAVVDFLPVATTESATTVVAVAVPRPACDVSRDLIERAGWKLGRLGLRALGSAALVDAGAPAARMLIDVSRETVEFTVVSASGVRFSRSADIDGSLDGDLATAVLTEARRTWMSYRIMDGADDITEAIVFGERDELAPSVQPLADMLQVPVRLFQSHPAIATQSDDVDEVWPLAGMLLESAQQVPTIDFTRPRRAVDQTAIRRRQGLMAAALLVVLMLIAWTMAKRDLDNRTDTLAELTKQQRSMYADDSRYVRDRLRYQHIEQWESAQVSWLEHFTWLAERMPEPQSLVLDGMTGTLQFRGVDWDRKEKEWVIPRTIALVLDGEARDRATADALRASLVRTDWLVTKSTGSDAATGRRHPHGFTYNITTGEGAPPEPDPSREATP